MKIKNPPSLLQSFCFRLTWLASVLIIFIFFLIEKDDYTM
jgi:hypothetical protein